MKTTILATLQIDNLTLALAAIAAFILIMAMRRARRQRAEIRTMDREELEIGSFYEAQNGNHQNAYRRELDRRNAA